MQKKYIFLPDQEITFLGFTINSQTMEITLTDAKMETMKACCREMLNETMLNAYYKYLEQVKKNCTEGVYRML